ncbi:MAG: hypothetical protein WA405_00895 [Candidatus Acidiferrales bacterium]
MAIPGNLFLYRPGGVAGGNVYTDWMSLMNAMNPQEGRKILEFDDSFAPCVIPAGPGPWNMTDVVWAGFGPRPGVPRTQVSIEDGAQFLRLRMIGGQLTIVNNVQFGPPPVSDFYSVGENHVHIGMRDDCGNTQIVNPGVVPMFDLGTHSAFFFVQNCLFGMPVPPTVIPVLQRNKLGQEVVGEFVVPGIASNPLIRQSAGSHLTLNLLGQNQTGPNVVSSQNGSTVLFGALSSAAQVALFQTSGGTIQFGPQGRIQRNVLPLPPASPTKMPIPISQINKPNVLILCDCTAGGFIQSLPAIAGGFTIGNTQIPLYSGGQEVVIAEVRGGTGLQVSPGMNTTTNKSDTIDGSTASVPIGAHGSRTFISDGASNWITISKV